VAIWRSGRSRRTIAFVVLVSLGVVGAAFVGGAVTGQHLASSDAQGATRGAEGAGDPPGNSPPKRRVFVYGDSLVVQSELYFPAVARAFGLAVTTRAFGGIAPCDALGWLREDLAARQPELVVFAFSGNSLTDCMRDASGKLRAGQKLLAAYRSDLDAAIAAATEARVPFVLASPPAPENRSRTWEQLDILFRDIAAAHPGVQYTDAGTQIAPDGQFAATQRCLPFELNLPQSKSLCLSEGGNIGVRSADGVHFCSDPANATTIAASCAEYSSGAFRYAIALVTAAKLDLDLLASLPALADPVAS
jgi:hypothetical protein